MNSEYADPGTVAIINTLMWRLNAAFTGKSWWEAASPLLPLGLGVASAFVNPQAGDPWHKTLVRGVMVGLAAMGTHAGVKQVGKTINPPGS